MRFPLKNWAMVVLLAFILVPNVSTLANKYDDEERIRRWAERAAQEEQAERDAAKKRIDKEEAGHRSSGNSGDGFLCILAVAAVVWGVFSVDLGKR